MGVIRVILIICLVYYGFKFIAKFLLPLLLKYLAGKTTNKFTQQKPKQQKPEGEVTIEKTVNNKPKIDTSVAEDVDFEEVE